MTIINLVKLQVVEGMNNCESLEELFFLFSGAAAIIESEIEISQNIKEELKKYNESLKQSSKSEEVHKEEDGQ